MKYYLALFSILTFFIIFNSCSSQKNLSNYVSDEKLTWTKMETEAYRGKQDDIVFVDKSNGWYINGYGNIFHTNNGGETWTKQLEKKGTFFRCIAFINKDIGFAGTVGTDYYPGVTDSIPLYGTKDGGKTWSPVPYKGPYVKGLCGIDIVKEQVIYQGQIKYNYHIFAVGRVGSPANFMVSNDNGNTWTSKSMMQDCKMLFDIKMFNKKEGLVAAANSENTAEGNALILRTSDGGNTWQKAYQSKRPYENVWKVSFPTRNIGYGTIQSYNPDTLVNQQHFIKTTNGGKTWKEYDFVKDHKARSFGVGFVNEKHGYIGTYYRGYETRDGGKTWNANSLGPAVIKVRIYQDDEGVIYGYAIGVEAYRLVVE